MKISMKIFAIATLITATIPAFGMFKSLNLNRLYMPKLQKRSFSKLLHSNSYPQARMYQSQLPVQSPKNRWLKIVAGTSLTGFAISSYSSYHLNNELQRTEELMDEMSRVHEQQENLKRYGL